MFENMAALFVVGAFAAGLWLTGHALWGMAADAAARRRGPRGHGAASRMQRLAPAAIRDAARTSPAFAPTSPTTGRAPRPAR